MAESGRLFQRIAEATPDAVHVYDFATGSTIFINGRSQDVIGYSAQEVMQRGGPFAIDLWHRDDAARLPELQQILLSLADEETYECEYRVRQPDGEYRWLRTRLSVFTREADGRARQVIGVTRDITASKRSEEGLHESEDRFRRYFELGLIGMAITSPVKGIVEVNGEICKILGYERSELLRMTWADITHPDDLAADVAQFNRVVAGEIDGYSMEKRWIRKDGAIITGNISVKCLRRDDGTVAHFVALLQDVTARKQAEEALVRAHDDLERRVAARTEELTIVNEQLRQEIRERKRAEKEAMSLRNALSAELAAMTRLHALSTQFGGDPDINQLLNDMLDATIALHRADFGNVQLFDSETNVLDIVAHRGFGPEFLDYFSKVTKDSTAGGLAWHHGRRVVIEDIETDPGFEPHRPMAASVGFCAVHSTPLLSRTGKVLGIISTRFRRPHRPSDDELRLTDLYVRHASDMIERKRNEAALLESQRQLHDLTSRLIEAQEAQSKLLARELHDVLSQRLAVIGMELAGVAQAPGMVQNDVLPKVSHDIVTLASDIHRMSRQLHPAILDDLGLSAAIKSECLAFSDQYKMPTEFASIDVPQTIPDAVALSLYRIAQESLRNVGKHAGVSSVNVTLRGSADEISLDVEDRGNGFDPDGIRGKRGLGLVSMEERVRMIGGTLSVASQPGQGTHVKARVPLQQHAS